jgi:hypothetical protein
MVGIAGDPGLGPIVTISARTTPAEAGYSTCGTASRFGHGLYRRRLDDVTLTGRRTAIDLEVQGFRCRVDMCPRRGARISRAVDPRAMPNSTSRARAAV